MNEINDNKKAMSEDVKQALIRFNKDNIYVQNLKIELVDMSLGYVKGKRMSLIHMVLCMVDACTHLRI